MSSILSIALLVGIKTTYPIDTQIAVMYLGASGSLTMKLPAMPPAPLKAVTAAAVNTRFPETSY
jgi:hypothetical protein